MHGRGLRKVGNGRLWSRVAGNGQAQPDLVGGERQRLEWSELISNGQEWSRLVGFG